jgi:hypothetical protein
VRLALQYKAGATPQLVIDADALGRILNDPQSFP